MFNIKSAFSIIIDDLNRLDVSMMLCLGLFVIHRKYYRRCSHRLEYRRYLLSLCTNIELALGWKLNKREHSQSRLRTDESSFHSHSLQYWGIFSLCLLLQFLISTGDQCSAIKQYLSIILIRTISIDIYSTLNIQMCMEGSGAVTVSCLVSSVYRTAGDR